VKERERGEKTLTKCGGGQRGRFFTFPSVYKSIGKKALSTTKKRFATFANSSSSEGKGKEKGGKSWCARSKPGGDMGL